MKNSKFETITSFKWFVVIMIVLLIIGIFVFVGIGVHNYPVKHTYVENPGAPGTLESDRYGYNWILITLSIGAQVLALFFLLSIIVWQKNYGCRIIWIVSYIISLLLILTVIALMGAQYADCNGADAQGNICNDLRWCCVFFVNPVNMCPNSIPCPGVVASTLRPKQAFLWIFWSNVALSFLHLVLIFAYASTPTVKTVLPKNEDDPAVESTGSSIFDSESVRKRHYK